MPKDNHWLRRIVLVLFFTVFDYACTLVFCKMPYEEANLYARFFMENLGKVSGLTLFVLIFNLPMYVVLSLDSHFVKLPHRVAVPFELFVDGVFSWFVAGLHFSGGSSWFWFEPDLTRQSVGAILYLLLAFLIVKPHRPRYEKCK